MSREKVYSREILLKQIALINKYFDDEEHIPYKEAFKTLILVGMTSKKNEKNSVSKVSDLKIKHNCYHTLQQCYRTISKEVSFTLINNITDDNVAIILGQFGIVQNLEQYLEKEEEIPLNILNEMNKRTVKSIGESAKTFKKINK